MGVRTTPVTKEIIDRWLGLKGKQARWAQLLILLAAVGLVLVFAAGALSPRSATPVPAGAGAAPAAEPEGLVAYEETLARNLEASLSRVAGAGRVTVQVSLSAGPLREVQVDHKTTSRTIQERDATGGTRSTVETDDSTQMVLVHGGNTDAPVVLRVDRPDVAGVLVVAEGAGDSRVREELTRDVATALHIPPNRIRVEEGRSP